jgi:RHS repeat-associated protein
VQYAYDESVDGSNVYDDGLRLLTMTYPMTSYPADYTYGSSGTSTNVNDRLGRVTRISMSSGVTIDANYSYNGTGRLVEVDSQSGQYRLRMLDIDGGGTNNYNGFDRFGRIKDHHWYNYDAEVDLARVKHGYDYAGNRLWREDVVAAANSENHDEYYTYDGLHRLTSFDRGNLTGTFPNYTGISGTPSKEEDFTLDQLGNWSGYVVKAAGTTTLNQSRAHNSVNEIDTDNTHGDTDDSITFTVGTNWRDPVHDAAGNMTTIGWRVALGTAEVLTYDAWNRLVKSYIGLVVQTNEYDGLGRRIVRVNGWANPDETYDYYYNENWQVVEQRKDGDANPSSQYYWHPYYIDALAFRIYDATLTGTDSVIHYYVHDANFNVTAILDDTADVLERYQYMPYGEVTFLEPDFDVAASQSSQHGNTHLYTGRERDPETARQLNRHRFYAPYMGRWLSRDPMGYEGSEHNLYEYVTGKAVSLNDASGLHTAALPICDCPPATQRSNAACCAAAVTAGIAGVSAGGVVCCDGRKVICVWLTGGVAGGGGTGNPAADAIIDSCITAHENQHIIQGDIAGGEIGGSCPKGCGYVSRPPFPLSTRLLGNQNRQECHAYRVELDCLTRNARAMCGGVVACEAAVEIRIAFIAGQIATRCR